MLPVPCGAADAAATPFTGARDPSALATPLFPVEGTSGLPAVESAYRESAVRRAENVFFISLPFTTLYAALLTGGAALAIERGDIRRPDLYLGISVGLTITASAWIAWRDHRALRPPRIEKTPPMNASPDGSSTP